MLKVITLICMVAFFYSNFFSSLIANYKNHLVSATVKLGWTFERLELCGVQHTKTSSILNALGIKAYDPILMLDLQAAHKRLLQLGWFHKCLLRRVLPNTLHLEAVEKIPIALWKHDNVLRVVDEQGYIIPCADPADFGHLLTIMGVGAPMAAYELWQAMKAAPNMGSKVLIALRHGQRRWDLHLQGDTLVKMPEVDMLKAWDYLVKLSAQGKLAACKVIDLRDLSKCYITPHEKK